MLKLVVKSSAWADIEAAAEWFEELNPDVADKFFTALNQTFTELRRHPALGRPRASLAGIRSWRLRGFENYLVFYRLAEGEIRILAVLHGARDLPRILGHRD